MSATVSSHFIPQFLIKYFKNEDGKVMEINLTNKPISPLLRRPEAILYQNNLYETKNLSGEYYKRNHIENEFSKIEAELSKKLPEIIKSLEDGHELSDDDKKELSCLVALQLVRMPSIKSEIEKNNADILDKQVMGLYNGATFISMLQSHEEGIQYLATNGIVLTEQEKEKIENINHKMNLIDYIREQIQINYGIYVIKTAYKAFCLGDRPVLINIYENVKYLFPFMPQYAIVCSITESINDGHNFNRLQAIDDNTVEFINQQTMSNAERFIYFLESDKEQLIDEAEQFIRRI